MTEKYAELKLYFGLCNSDGCGEGRFSPQRKDNTSSVHFDRAMKTVQYYLAPERSYGFRFGIAEHLVHDDKEASKLIEFAEKNIRGAWGVIELDNSRDGQLSFWKKIQFMGWTENQKEKLISELKKSKYIPRDENRERIEAMLKMKGMGENWQATINDKLAQLDPDRPWRDGLKFY